LKVYDPQNANWDCESCLFIQILLLLLPTDPQIDVAKIEGMIPQQYGQDAKEIAGSRRILSALKETGAPWAIVTSGTRPLVDGWLERLGLAHPKQMVTAEEVEHGKPDPACYLLGRTRLGLSADTPILVIEDSPAGIKSGKAAGCHVLGLTTTHTVREVQEAGADWVVEDLQSVTFEGWDSKTGRMTLQIKPELVIPV
jgi:glycerol-1-phosphatase